MDEAALSAGQSRDVFMRMRTGIIAASALAVATFVAGAVYHHYSTTPPKGGDWSSPLSAPDAATGSVEGFSFAVLETPKPLPELTFVNEDGREMMLDAFEGQMVLLNIWATWCVPCREEMPSLDRLQARLGGPDFRVVPLSIDREGLPSVKAFYQELGLEHLGIYVDQTGKVSRQLGAVGIPTTLLVDRDRRETGRTVGPAEWDSDEVVDVLEKHLSSGTAAPQSAGGGKQ